MIVEEERRRMLAQNVERLIGHIPKGVLSEVNDYNLYAHPGGHFDPHLFEMH